MFNDLDTDLNLVFGEIKELIEEANTTEKKWCKWLLKSTKGAKLIVFSNYLPEYLKKKKMCISFEFEEMEAPHNLAYLTKEYDLIHFYSKKMQFNKELFGEKDVNNLSELFSDILQHSKERKVSFQEIDEVDYIECFMCKSKPCKILDIYSDRCPLTEKEKYELSKRAVESIGFLQDMGVPIEIKKD